MMDAYYNFLIGIILTAAAAVIVAGAVGILRAIYTDWRNR